MIISLLFEPFSNSSLQHLCFVCAIWHDCIFGGNGRLYTGFWVVLSLSTLYFWLAGKAKTKRAVNRMSEWVEGGGSWKGHESGQAVFIYFCRGFAARSRALRARISRLRRSCARLDKTAMLRTLRAEPLDIIGEAELLGRGASLSAGFWQFFLVNRRGSIPI